MPHYNLFLAKKTLLVTPLIAHVHRTRKPDVHLPPEIVQDFRRCTGDYLYRFYRFAVTDAASIGYVCAGPRESRDTLTDTRHSLRLVMPQLGFNGWLNLATDIIKPMTTNDVSVAAEYPLDRTK